jgi:hypothetical protein
VSVAVVSREVQASLHASSDLLTRRTVFPLELNVVVDRTTTRMLTAGSTDSGGPVLREGLGSSPWKGSSLEEVPAATA